MPGKVDAQNFTKAGESDATRCASRGELLQRGCALKEVVEARSRHQVLEDAPLSDSAEQETVTQLAPQKIALWLRPGEQHSFSVRFKRAKGYPVDVYYLMDLSYSMKDDLENIKKLGNDLLAALRNITKSVKIGFGSFVDKTVLPYVSTVPAKLRNPCPDRYEQCDSPVSFRHVLPLTDNASEFESRVSQQRISGNLDSPEGGFDAIVQVAVCEKQIGWRNVTRLLVFTSDDVFHTAGDGKLGGIYLPNDNQCHLDTDGLYSKSHIYDYPSVGHLAQVLSASNVQPIFAVTGSTLPVYQDGVECSGHGRCLCNKCQCQPGYFDRLCSWCPGCQTPCEEHRDCADCKAFGTGPLSQNCSTVCNHTTATVLPEPAVSEQWCREKTEDGRILLFLIEGTDGGTVRLTVKAKDAVTGQTSMIVLGLVSGIVVIGLLIIIAYRISVEVLDRREYMRFEKERERARGNEVNNPLYRSATTTVINPRYNED
ncbi:Integrin beta-7 [Chelonia mydas]|uniref:Integrin beta n=1 Tax=Chelonia mydas TaxID=8469 RepID=M7BGC0_CHEMY|nr:Integrin beta-7 [Chelonia mydas]